MQMHRMRFGSNRRRLATQRLPNARLPAALRYRGNAVDEPADPLARTAAMARVEAVLMMADEPIASRRLSEIAGLEDGYHARRVVEELRTRFDADGTAFQIEDIAGGFQLLTRSDYHASLLRLRRTGYDLRLSGAALETLAVIAYKQPISRAQVSAVRGVNADGVIRTLTQRGYIDEIARDPGPGQAVLLGTTRDFLERMGLDSLEELPGVADFVPGPEVVEALERGLALDATEPIDPPEPVVGHIADGAANGVEARPVSNGEQQESPELSDPPDWPDPQ